MAASQAVSVNSAGTAVTWIRGRASPEVDWGTFEKSTDLVAWTSLGGAARTGTGNLHTQAQFDGNRMAGRNDAIASPNTYNLYTLSQLQALHVRSPLIAKDLLTGKFKLTIGVGKSTDLIHYQPFPFLAPNTTVNGNGAIEFLFTVPDNVAFFISQAQ